jgi:hypothetical protein
MTKKTTKTIKIIKTIITTIISESSLVAIITISIQDAVLRIAAVGKVIRLFKKRLLTMTRRPYDKFRSMLVLLLKNIFLNIREIFDSLSFVVLFTKIPKGTQWESIISIVRKNKLGLVGLDKFDKNSVGAEWVSNIFEMGKVQSQNNGHLYLPLPDSINHSPTGSQGKLFDGLVFDPSSGLVVSRIEFKSQINTHLGPHLLNKFSRDYGSLGVDRLDLCCLNSESFKQTVFNVNQLDHNLAPLLNPVDYSTVFTEPTNDSYINNVNEVISNQIALKSKLTEVLNHLLSTDQIRASTDQILASTDQILAFSQ